MAQSNVPDAGVRFRRPGAELCRCVLCLRLVQSLQWTPCRAMVALHGAGMLQRRSERVKC